MLFRKSQRRQISLSSSRKQAVEPGLPPIRTISALAVKLGAFLTKAGSFKRFAAALDAATFGEASRAVALLAVHGQELGHTDAGEGFKCRRFWLLFFLRFQEETSGLPPRSALGLVMVAVLKDIGALSGG